MADLLFTVIALAIVMVPVILFVWGIYRFGGVEQGWLLITDVELARLQKLHDENSAPEPPERWVGKPLYRHAMSSHEALAIYSNGVRAKLCLGREGKFEFVPYSRLSGIYPVTLDIPGLKNIKPSPRLSRFRPVWEEIQLETVDGRVFCIDGRTHELDRVRVLLEQAIGSRWKDLFRPEEAITGSFLSAGAYLHKIIRDARAAGKIEGKMLPMTFDADYLPV